jgi:hypothetical protein
VSSHGELPLYFTFQVSLLLFVLRGVYHCDGLSAKGFERIFFTIPMACQGGWKIKSKNKPKTYKLAFI